MNQIEFTFSSNSFSHVSVIDPFVAEHVQTLNKINDKYKNVSLSLELVEDTDNGLNGWLSFNQSKH